MKSFLPIHTRFVQVQIRLIQCKCYNIKKEKQAGKLADGYVVEPSLLGLLVLGRDTLEGDN